MSDTMHAEELLDHYLQALQGTASTPRAATDFVTSHMLDADQGTRDTVSEQLHGLAQKLGH